MCSFFFFGGGGGRIPYNGLYGEAPPQVGVPITGLRVGNLLFPVDGRSIKEKTNAFYRCETIRETLWFFDLSFKIHCLYKS